MEKEDFRSFLAYFKVGNIQRKYLAIFYTDKKNCFVVFIFMTETKEKNPQINFSNQNLSIESNLTKI